MTEHRIERLGHQGDGIADGPIYAHGALPGELVSGVVDGDRLEQIRIIEPSPMRIKAPCRHYKSCGGCALQHARDDFVADWKAGVVLNALAAQGIEARVEGVWTSSERSRRRAVLHGQRTKKGSIVGYFGRASGALVDVPDCQVINPQLAQTLPALHELTRAGASRSGQITYTITATEAGVDVAAEGGKAPDGAMLATLAALAGKHNLARLTWDDEVLAMNAPPKVRFGPALVLPPAGAFLQATVEGETAICDAIGDIVGNATRVADLFAGCGTLSLPMTAKASVHAVEGVESMLSAALAGWRDAGGLHKMSVETRDLFHRPLLATELVSFDAAIIDPPRAGAAAQTKELAASKIKRIASVSCNPVTFARDAKILIDAGYKMGPVRVVDQFRWSTHVELVAGFTLI